MTAIRKVATMLKLSNMSDQKFQRFSALVYGEPETGKTWQVRLMEPMLKRTADGKPDWSRVLYVAADPGMRSISDLADIKVFKPYVDGTPSELLRGLQEAKGQFDLVFIDGLDILCRTVLRTLEAEEMKKAKPDTRGVWGTYGKVIVPWIEQMRDLEGVNVVFTCHVEEDSGSDIRYKPATAGGKMLDADTLVGMFDYVFYAMIGNKNPNDLSKPKERIFITTRGGDSQYHAKSRVPANVEPLPARIEADLGKVWKHMFASGK